MSYDVVQLFFWSSAVSSVGVLDAMSLALRYLEDGMSLVLVLRLKSLALFLTSGVNVISAAMRLTLDRVTAEHRWKL